MLKLLFCQVNNEKKFNNIDTYVLVKCKQDNAINNDYADKFDTWYVVEKPYCVTEMIKNTRPLDIDSLLLSQRLSFSTIAGKTFIASFGFHLVNE